ncbi:hypothetical protein J40TS1_33440 [Paenibacillus montaniterrae]|uniref:Uncharacterized protein n=1 Tax=Paenibacillus montaniterrae TaxID=429341 RepID=A0A919YNG0_9BACL|nr:hypothetical protein [Paenibacillus montaniterrae]GIP17702.1 hypothetical protein J40TS1_33440 [Paenibacillus montaniterrae]
MKFKHYFVIGSTEWRTTVKWSLIAGVVLGLMIGTSYLLNTL